MANQYNPYQAPAFDQVPNTPAGDFSVGQAFQESFDNTKRNAGVAIGMVVVAGLCMVLSAMTVIGYFIVVPVLAWGMVRFLLNMHDGTPQIGDLFAGFSSYGKSLGRTLLLTVVVMVVSLVAESGVFVGQFMKSVPIQALGWVIYATFFVLVIGRLYFAFFFVVDQDMPAMEALSASWQVTQGKGFKVFLLLLVSSLIGMLGVLALCVGVLFTLPLSYAMYVSAYRQMVGGPRTQASPLQYGGPAIS